MAKRYTTHVGRHDIGLVELTKRDQRTLKVVAHILAREGEYSVFDVTATDELGETMSRIAQKGWFEFTPRVFPWTTAKLTEAGKKALGVDQP